MSAWTTLIHEECTLRIHRRLYDTACISHKVRSGRGQQSLWLVWECRFWRRNAGQSDFYGAASVSQTVCQLEGTAVGLGDLAREYESDTAASWFCGVERNEYIARIH